MGTGIELSRLWGDFFRAEMPLATDQFLAGVAQTFAINNLVVDASSAGYENLLLFLNDGGTKYVLRLTSQRTEAELEAEVRFVNALMAAGFHAVPEFLPSGSGRYSTTICQTKMTLYRYIRGNSRVVSLDAEYQTFVNFLYRYFEALTSARAAILNCRRRHFPSPELIIESLHTAFQKQPSLMRRLDSLPLQRLASLRSMAPPFVIHSDIHPTNILWASPQHIEALIDFDDCMIADTLIEFAAITRGCCFEEGRLRVDRLALLWKGLQRFLPGAPFDHIHDTIVIVCLYFAWAVNRPRDFGPPRTFSYTDIDKAVAASIARREVIDALREC